MRHFQNLNSAVGNSTKLRTWSLASEKNDEKVAIEEPFIETSAVPLGADSFERGNPTLRHKNNNK